MKLPSQEQFNHLKAFAAANGRCWKEQLRYLWMDGRYRDADLGEADSAVLQQIRNEFGPAWLVAFSFKKVGAELTKPSMDV